MTADAPRQPEFEIKLVAGNSNRPLFEDIARHLEMTLTKGGRPAPARSSGALGDSHGDAERSSQARRRQLQP